MITHEYYWIAFDNKGRLLAIGDTYDSLIEELREIHKDSNDVLLQQHRVAISKEVVDL